MTIKPCPPEILAALRRLEAKRIWRETWEARVEQADMERTRKKEEGHE